MRNSLPMINLTLSYLTLNKRAKCAAFTIVELLIALALGLTLSGAITKIYLQNNASLQQDEQIARLQENARYALKMLTREIGMAGFIAGTPEQNTITSSVVSTGCAPDTWALNLTTPLDFINDVTNASTLTTTSGISITCSPSDLLTNTDIISIKRTADRPTAENGAVASHVASVGNQWYMRLSDSRSDKSWRYVAANGTFESADTATNSDIDYWAYYHKIFYLKNITQNSKQVPTLCAQVLIGSSMAEECYVEGIENVQIEIGLDTNQDSTPDIFKSAPSATEMADAVVVRLYLLARSPEEIPGYTNNKTYYCE